MNESHSGNFGNVAGHYGKYRDELPEIIFDQLRQRGVDVNGRQVVDLGSGTGIFSRALARQGAHVIGIEPESRLILEAEARDNTDGSRIQYIQAPAEEMPLPSQSADIVTALRAWHWFDRPRAIGEVQRILKRGGQLIVIHSSFLPQQSEAARMTLKTLKEHLIQLKPAGSMGECKERRNGLPVIWFKEWEESGFHFVDEWQYHYDLIYTKEAWCGKVGTLSWITDLAEERKQSIMMHIRETLAPLSEPFIVPHQYSVVVMKAE